MDNLTEILNELDNVHLQTMPTDPAALVARALRFLMQQRTEDMEALRTNAWVIVDTYAGMLAVATGNSYKRIKVRQDENKGMASTTYDYWPTIGVDWVAVTKEI